MLEHAYSRMTIILVGNKKDLESEREVSYEEGAEFAKKNKLIFFETLALAPWFKFSPKVMIYPSKLVISGNTSVKRESATPGHDLYKCWLGRLGIFHSLNLQTADTSCRVSLTKSNVLWCWRRDMHW